MKQMIMIALRDLSRNRRRSFFSALALGIGVALLLLMAGVVSGEMDIALDSAIQLQSGHLQVRVKGYNEDRTSLAYEDLVEAPDQLAAQIAQMAPVLAATPRLFATGIAAVGDRSVGLLVVGIDPASVANKPFRDGLIAGSFISADDREGVMIGQTLAEKIKVKAGDHLTLLVNTSNGDVDQQSFVIRGIYTTHTPGFDENTVFIPLAKAQAITRTENHASILFVLLKDKEQTNAVVSALQSSQYEVRTWQQMNQLILETGSLSSAFMVVLYIIVLAITATVVVNTMVMAVFERTREIGILAAVGMRSGRIMNMFLVESTILTLGGIALGLVMGGLMTLYATNVGFYIGNYGATGILIGETIYARLTLADTVTLTVVALIISLIASLYPARIAANMEPVEALRGGKG